MADGGQTIGVDELVRGEGAVGELLLPGVPGPGGLAHRPEPGGGVIVNGVPPVTAAQDGVMGAHAGADRGRALLVGHGREGGDDVGVVGGPVGAAGRG